MELYNRFQQMIADYTALPAGQEYDGIRPLKKETQLALWISLGTLCRIGELLQAEWKMSIWPDRPGSSPAKTSKVVGDHPIQKTVRLSPDGVMTTPWSWPIVKTATGRRITCVARGPTLMQA
ncbi:hypothetical protein ACVWVZ_000047 [Pseudomonas tolaasii]